MHAYTIDKSYTQKGCQTLDILVKFLQSVFDHCLLGQKNIYVCLLSHVKKI